MGWRERRANCGGLALVPVLLAIAVLTSGCFQPLYGEASLTTGNSSVRDALGSVDVQPIDTIAGSSETKLAVQIRNDLMFSFTGGGSPGAPAYRLKVNIVGGRGLVIVDRASQLPNAENYALTATYTLTELATGKPVVSGRTNTTVSYDPSGTQRFARVSALHDGERRAAKVISDSITTRLASYFISGS